MKQRRFFTVTLSACEEGGRTVLFDRMGYRCGHLDPELVGVIVDPDAHFDWRSAVVAMKASLNRQMRSQREAYAAPWRRWAIHHATRCRSRQRQIERRGNANHVNTTRGVLTWRDAADRMRADLSRKFLASQPWYAWAHSTMTNFNRREDGVRP